MAHSEGEAQSDTKIATAAAQRGIKKFVQSQDREERREEGRGQDGVLPAASGPVDFFLPAHLYPPA